MTASRGLRRLLLVAAAAFLVGATAFGLWHVVVGGLVHGNVRAAGFGIVLATGGVGLLAAIQRWRPLLPH